MTSIRSILLVDDEPGDVHLVHRALSSLGCDAVLYAVQSGQLASEFLAKQDAFRDMPTPDVVVLDLHMPDGDGYAVLAALKADARWAAIPVAVLTFDDSPAARERCLALGAEDFTRKPGDHAGYRIWGAGILRLIAARNRG